MEDLPAQVKATTLQQLGKAARQEDGSKGCWKASGIEDAPPPSVSLRLDASHSGTVGGTWQQGQLCHPVSAEISGGRPKLRAVLVLPWQVGGAVQRSGSQKLFLFFFLCLASGPLSHTAVEKLVVEASRCCNFIISSCMK